MQCLVGHVQLWGWRGAQGSQKSWVGQMPASPPPVHGAEAVRGARERQLWGWRGAQGRQRRWAGRGPKAPLRVGETAAGSGMSWRATVAYVAISPVKPSVIGYFWCTIAKIHLFSQRGVG